MCVFEALVFPFKRVVYCAYKIVGGCKVAVSYGSAPRGFGCKILKKSVSITVSRSPSSTLCPCRMRQKKKRPSHCLVDEKWIETVLRRCAVCVRERERVDMNYTTLRPSGGG